MLCAQANWKFHELTTGPEILADFEGKKLDYWVTGCVCSESKHPPAIMPPPSHLRLRARTPPALPLDFHTSFTPAFTPPALPLD